MTIKQILLQELYCIVKSFYTLDFPPITSVHRDREAVEYPLFDKPVPIKHHISWRFDLA